MQSERKNGKGLRQDYAILISLTSFFFFFNWYKLSMLNVVTNFVKV